MSAPPIVTAVGRLLTPRNGEPQMRRTITRRPDGTFKITPAGSTTADRRR